MCNEYERFVAWQEYRSMLAAHEIPVPDRQGELDLPLAASVRIGDTAPVMRAAGNSVELAPMRFGFPPARPKGGPVFNFRSEGRRFADSRRCLIPASAFFEFTGAKYPKTRHRFTLKDAPFLCIAGIWRVGPDGAEAFTMLTTQPGPDVAPIHDRQVVVLGPQDWSAWIYLTRPEAELLQPSPAGTLQAEIVRKGTAGKPEGELL